MFIYITCCNSHSKYSAIPYDVLKVFRLNSDICRLSVTSIVLPKSWTLFMKADTFFITKGCTIKNKAA